MNEGTGLIIIGALWYTYQHLYKSNKLIGNLAFILIGASILITDSVTNTDNLIGTTILLGAIIKTMWDLIATTENK